MEDFIRGELLKRPRPKANCIFQGLVTWLERQNRDCPGEDAIIKRITKLRKADDEHPPSGLDVPWSIGVCMKAEIPGHIIPILLGTQKRLLEEKAKLLKITDKLSKQQIVFRRQVAESVLLTIREAKWVALLWPALVTTATKQMPKSRDPLSQANRIIAKAKLYAFRERIAEIKGVEYPDTTDIDSSIGDFSDSATIKDILKYTGVKKDGE